MNNCNHSRTVIDRDDTEGGVAPEICVVCCTVVDEHAVESDTEVCGHYEDGMKQPCQNRVSDGGTCWRHP